MVDSGDLKSPGRNAVWVRLPLPVPASAVSVVLREWESKAAAMFGELAKPRGGVASSTSDDEERLVTDNVLVFPLPVPANHMLI